jgi:hypothetical protein
MPYRPINAVQVSQPNIKRAIERANDCLHDVYSMFELSASDTVHKERFVFSITLVLLCVIDGISCEIYPTRLVKDQEKRFKKLIRDKLYWANSKPWIDKADAANQLYLEVRNPLVHELARDKMTRARKPGHNELTIGKWDKIGKTQRNIESIDAMKNWNGKWPTMYVKKTSGDGRPCVKLNTAALYWSVKRMLEELVCDTKVMEYAVVCQDALAILEAE